MKNIITSLGIIVFAGAVVAGATGAFFSDTETSLGNVFTAGSVSLELTSIEHTYKNSVLPDPTGFKINVPQPGTGPSFTFTDLKPLDWGVITGEILNGENDTFVCARVTGVEEDSPFRDMLMFRTGTGPVGDIVDAVELNKWFSPTLPAASLAALPMEANDTASVPLQYCFGEFIPNGGCELDPAVADYNLAQNQELKIDIEYYAVQQRNNENFNCANLDNVVKVSAPSLATDLATLTANPTKWLFHNDSIVGTSPNIVMSLNQFTTTGGVNNIVAAVGSNGAAYMKLDTGTDPLYVGANINNPRYNIATYQFKDVKLADISSLKYRINDASVSSQTPFLHFNIDFNNTDVWQRRLVQVPTGVVANTWTVVDALAGTWNLSGGNWPVGTTEDGNTPGSTLKTWANILAEYPNAETRSTDSFLGVRVGHPGPIGEEGYVDWVEFDGVTYDFVN